MPHRDPPLLGKKLIAPEYTYSESGLAAQCLSVPRNCQWQFGIQIIGK
jgi:hypothetical protein